MHIKCTFMCTQYLVGPPLAWITASICSICHSIEAINLCYCVGVMETQITLIAGKDDWQGIYNFYAIIFKIYK